jgi:hypothetical protein
MKVKHGGVCFFGGSLESGGLFYVGALGRNLASDVKMVSRLIYLKINGKIILQ